MINANELRIGNVVTASFQKNYRVNISALEEIGIGSKEYEPIPLTPEILEKCGFEAIYFSDQNIYGALRNDASQPSLLISLYDKPHIQYLHQLQNLYFALTGEELNVNF